MLPETHTHTHTDHNLTQTHEQKYEMVATVKIIVSF